MPRVAPRVAPRAAPVDQRAAALESWHHPPCGWSCRQRERQQKEALRRGCVPKHLLQPSEPCPNTSDWSNRYPGVDDPADDHPSGGRQQQQQRRVEVILVVSHCRENLTWVAKSVRALGRRQPSPPQFVLSSLSVVSKCGLASEAERALASGGLSAALRTRLNVHILQLPNVGRCDETYAAYIARSYARLSTRPRALVVMIKGSRLPSVTNTDDFIALLQRTHRDGFACDTPPFLATRAALLSGGELVHVDARDYWAARSPPLGAGSVWHVWPRLARFHMKDYNKQHDQSPGLRTNGRGKLVFRKANASSGGSNASSATFHAGFRGPPSLHRRRDAPLDLIGFLLDKQILPERQLDVLLEQPIWPVCYCGGFAFRAAAALQHPQDAWARLDDALSRDNNIEEGHFAERLWAPLLTDPRKFGLGADLLCNPHARVSKVWVGRISQAYPDPWWEARFQERLGNYSCES